MSILIRKLALYLRTKISVRVKSRRHTRTSLAAISSALSPSGTPPRTPVVPSSSERCWALCRISPMLYHGRYHNRTADLEMFIQTDVSGRCSECPPAPQESSLNDLSASRTCFLCLSFVPYPISEFFCFFTRLRSRFFFFVALVSRVAFFFVLSHRVR